MVKLVHWKEEGELQAIPSTEKKIGHNTYILCPHPKQRGSGISRLTVKGKTTEE